MGCSQAVRQRFLVPCTVGSNPTTPAMPHTKDRDNKDVRSSPRVGSLSSASSVAQAATQTAPQPASMGCASVPLTVRRTRRRATGARVPHLQLRGRVFHFRRRVPTHLQKRGARGVSTLSLATELAFEAAKRVEILLAALERAERDVAERTELTGAEIDAILTEVARSTLARMLADQHDDERSPDNADKRIAVLEKRIAELRSAGRRRDYASIEPALREAGETLSVELDIPVPSALGKPAAGVLRELAEVEIATEDGDDVEVAGADIAARFSSAGVRRFATAPVMFSTAFERAAGGASSPDMRRNTEATGRLFLALMGDRPVAAMDTATMEEFLHLVSRLPKSHGKAHGRNRYEVVGRDIDKRAEIAEADAADQTQLEAMRAREDLPLAERRARLTTVLVPRLTMTTVRRHRDALNRILKAAVEQLGAVPGEAVPSYKRMDALIRERAPTDCLHVRVARPKTRMPWTKERIQALLMSPIYRGCASPSRRWEAGALVIRDATYWVPLVMMTMGTRVEEVLELKRLNLVLRNGLFCLAFGLDPDQSVKTRDSERVVPIPQLLLDLGLVEWAKAKDGSDALLFPCAARRTSGTTLSGAFGKHLRNLMYRLGVADFDEDLYALRKTLATELARLNIADGRRQAIAGHKGGAIINRHYTAHDTAELKRELDLVDLGLTITRSTKHGFPVIADCRLVARTPAQIDIALGDDHGACAVRLTSSTGEELFIARARGASAVPDDWTHAPRLDLPDIAQRIRPFLDDTGIRPPKERTRRLAFEHLCAMA